MDSSLPECPVCRKEQLIPLSAVYGTGAPAPAEKTFAHWICPRCGFYLGTGGLAGYNIPKDIQITMLEDVVHRIRECSKIYEKAVKEGKFSD